MLKKSYFKLKKKNIFISLKRNTYIYSIVPQKVWVSIPSLMCSLHKPKSVNLTCPWASNKIFSGLRSLYIIPCPCKCSKARIISDK